MDGRRSSFRWCALNATGLDVRIDDISETTAALAVQDALPPRPRAGDGEGLVRPPLLPPPPGLDRRCRHRRHEDRVHGGSRLRALDPTGGCPRGLGPPLRGRRRLWAAARRDPGARHLPSRGQPDPDRSRVYERPPRVRAGAQVFAVRDGLGRSSSSTSSGFTGKRALGAEREAGGPRDGSLGWTRLVRDRVDVREDGLARDLALVHRAPVPVYREGHRSAARLGRMGSTSRDGRVRFRDKT